LAIFDDDQRRDRPQPPSVLRVATGRADFFVAPPLRYGASSSSSLRELDPSRSPQTLPYLRSNVLRLFPRFLFVTATMSSSGLPVLSTQNSITLLPDQRPLFGDLADVSAGYRSRPGLAQSRPKRRWWRPFEPKGSALTSPYSSPSLVSISASRSVLPICAAEISRDRLFGERRMWTRKTVQTESE